MKKCSYCAEEIQDEALKCKHCGSDLTAKASVPIGKRKPKILRAWWTWVLVGIGLLWAGIDFYKGWHAVEPKSPVDVSVPVASVISNPAEKAIAPSQPVASSSDKTQEAIADIKTIKAGAFAYYSDTNKLPAQKEDLLKDNGISGWDGPYLTSYPATNPWGGKCVLYSALGCCRLTLSDVPEDAAKEIDRQIDNNTGSLMGIVSWRKGDVDIVLISPETKANEQVTPIPAQADWE